MSTHPQLGRSADETLANRQEAGRWLRTLRENAKLSQRQLAAKIDIEYYTFISQIESGRGRVPPGQYASFADAFGIPVRQLVVGLMRYYDPITFEILFGEKSGGQASAEPNDLSLRIARLEAAIGGQSAASISVVTDWRV